MTSAALAYAPDFVPRGESEGPALAASIFAEGAQTREDLRLCMLRRPLRVRFLTLTSLLESGQRDVRITVIGECA